MYVVSEISKSRKVDTAIYAFGVFRSCYNSVGYDVQEHQLGIIFRWIDEMQLGELWFKAFNVAASTLK